MSLEDRNWTAFMLDAEHDHHGYRRMVSVHNALRARIAELEARLSRAENVCKAADKAPCRHSNDHTELGCEVCDALAAWREGK